MLTSNKSICLNKLLVKSKNILFLIFLLGSISFITTGCKSQKKIAAEQDAAKKATEIKQAIGDLQALLNDTNKTPDQKEKELAAIKRRGIKDPNVLALIKKLEAKITKEKAELNARKEKEAKEKEITTEKNKIRNLLKDGNVTLDQKEKELKRIKGLNIKDAEIKDLIDQLEANITAEKKAKENAEEVQPTLQEFFEAVIKSKNLGLVKQKIEKALQLFSSDQTPVLIVISRSGGIKDYDRPTTIKKYLEYLKDQKINPNDVENVVYDSNGKIKELELIKKSIK